MLVPIKCWKITVKFTDRVVVLWIHDNHMSNLLRTLAGLQFAENGLEQPTEIIIGV